MTKPYSMDLRERVVSAVDAEGMSRHEAAARFGIAVSSAIRWMARYRKTGNVAPSKIGGYKPKTLRGEHASWLVARCQESDFTISQLVEELLSLRGLKVDRRSVWEFLHAEGLSHIGLCRLTGARSLDVCACLHCGCASATHLSLRLLFIYVPAPDHIAPLLVPHRAAARWERSFRPLETMTFIAALRRHGSPRRASSMVPSMARSSWPGCASSFRRLNRARSSSWHLGSHRGKAVRGAIRSPEPSSCSCPILPRPHPSSRSLQISNTCSGRRRLALMTPCSPPFALFSKATLRNNAPTILQIAHMTQTNLNPLLALISHKINIASIRLKFFYQTDFPHAADHAYAHRV